MQEYRLSFFIMGLAGCVFSLLMLIPAGVEYFMEDQLNFDIFVNSSMIGFFLSALVVTTFYNEEAKISHRASFVATTLVWVKISLIASLPLYFAHYPNNMHISFADAVFEATSGITTTGITVLTNLDSTSKGVLLWRAMLHFFGGIGIITLVFVIMPYLQGGVMQLFTAESSESYSKETPRIMNTVIFIFTIYLVCTGLCGCLYYIFGMSIFDAICHAMSTVSSGGFTNYNSSFIHFNSTAIETTAIVFMVISAIPFIVTINLFLKGKLRYNAQTVTLLAIIPCASFAIALYFKAFDGQTIRHILFAVTALVTTTGFVCADFSQSGDFFFAILITIGLIGGCSGSTSGGLKIFRVQVFYQMVRHHFLKVIYPHMVRTIKTNGQEITQSTVASTTIFLILFLGSIIFLFLLLTAYNFDMKNTMALITAIVGNTGVIVTEYGPSGVLTSNFTEAVKLILSVSIDLGRLEFIAVIIIIIQLFKRV